MRLINHVSYGFASVLGVSLIVIAGIQSGWTQFFLMLMGLTIFTILSMINNLPEDEK